MQSQFTRIPVSDLRLGMFVSELDRPWLDSPFLMQGFVVSKDSELSVIQDLCQSVVIDARKSPIMRFNEKKKKPRRSNGKTLKQTFSHLKLQDYKPKTSLDDELKSAKSIYDSYESAVSKLYDSAKSGLSLNIKTANEAVGEIVESLVRNPGACTLLHQLRRKGNYLYDHAIGTSIWSAAIGRQIGLPPAQLKRLAIGGLLCDIGKVEISNRILDKPGKLTLDEYELIKAHVETDEGFSKKHPGLTQSIVEIIQTHHERHDGSGYPKGLAGNAIPVFARIVGLADSYDAMTSEQAWAKPMSSYDAAKELYDLRDILFQSEIVEQFIQAVGLYPVGSLVELNRGDVGVVTDIYASRRLRPKLLLMLDANKKPLEEPVFLDLLNTPQDDDGKALEILRCLEPGSYDLNPDEFFS